MSVSSSFGRYRILEPLGRGGMGRVFLAEDPILQRRVAIKLLPDEYRADAGRRERLLQEARAASSLNHPNIVVIHDLGESDDHLYVAMEHVAGVTVRAWAAGARHTPAECLALLRQAARALDAAHRANLVHRDLKPENLMVREDGVLKVLDFGLARSTAPAADTTLTMTGMLVGTVPYMAPEQVLGQPALPASDLFSLGVILYELLTGRHPFASDSWIETMNRILHEDPEPPSRLAPALGAEFDFVLGKALSKDPACRHAGAADLENDLASLERRDRPRPVPARGTRPRSLAVLPFKNIGGDPKLAYLSLGLADAVITQLATSPDLIVRATSAVTRYESQPADLRRVAEDLEVDAVLDASFQLVGGRLRATARLVEVATSLMLWAGKVDVASDDAFELQDRVAQGIAEALTPKPAETVSGGVQRPDDAVAPLAGGRATPKPRTAAARIAPQAYEHFLRGLDAYRRFGAEEVRTAIGHFEEAVRLAPKFARAWAMLGEAREWIASMGWDSDPIWFARGEEALARARSLDPDDPFVHYLAATLHIARGRLPEAYADLGIALRGMPHFPHVYHYFAYVFRLAGLLDHAEDAERRCWEIEGGDPFPYTNMIVILALRGDFEGSREWLERGRLRFGNTATLELAELSLLWLSGRDDEILERFRAADDRRGQALSHAPLALAHLRGGDRERAERIAGHLESFAAIDMDAAGWAASYHAWAGETDRSFTHLARAVELGLHSPIFYEHPRLFEPIRRDPRWAPFIEDVRARAERYRREMTWPVPG